MFVYICASEKNYSAKGISLRPQQRSGFHPVPTPILGGIESFVGVAQEHLAIQRFLLALFHGSEPKAESKWNLAHASFDHLVGNAVAQTFGADAQIGRITTGQDNQEFFSAIASNRVVRSNVGREPPRRFLQDNIAYKMAVRVINFLKVIYVGHDHAQCVAVSLTTRYFSSKQINDGTTIPKPGERIVGRSGLQFILGMHQGRL